MGNVIISALMTFISGLTSIFEPVINSVLSLIPGLSDLITRVTTFFTYIFTFVPLVLDFLMIPRQALLFLFNYYVIKYAIYLLIRGLKCILYVYNKLKP